jgi:hypothetical protein
MSDQFILTLNFCLLRTSSVTYNGKVKLSFFHGLACWESEATDPLILNLDARRTCVVSCTFNHFTSGKIIPVSIKQKGVNNRFDLDNNFSVLQTLTRHLSTELSKLSWILYRNWIMSARRNNSGSSAYLCVFPVIREYLQISINAITANFLLFCKCDHSYFHIAQRFFDLINPLTPNDLQRRRAVSPLKIKIPSKYMREKPTNTTIIHSVY